MKENKYKWHKIDGYSVNRFIKILQRDIVVAYRNNDIKKVYELQTKLICSFSGRAMSVRRTTTSSGKKTAGVDKVILKSPEDKGNAIGLLQKYTKYPNQYKASNVKRVMIPKMNGKERPLGIPTQIDRALQNVVLLALDPIIEETSDLHSYGFRKFRSAGLAMTRIRHILDKNNAPRYVGDADIKGCFDNITFNAVDKALIKKICPLGSKLIKKGLNSGIVYKGKTTFPGKGIPQGGVISPLLMNAVLNGLEKCVRGKNITFATAISQKEFNSLKGSWPIRYADDFIVTCSNKEELEEIIIPKIKSFLYNKGLEVSKTKTQIVDLHENKLEFLGGEVRTPLRYGGLNKKKSKNFYNETYKRKFIEVSN